MSVIETQLRAKVFQRFIDENPIAVTLMRSARVKTTAGGWSELPPVAQAAQTGRLIYSGNKGDNVERTLADGSVLVITHRLVFMPGANVQRGDYFDHDGHRYRVGWVSSTPDWRVACEVGRSDA